MTSWPEGWTEFGDTRVRLNKKGREVAKWFRSPPEDLHPDFYPDWFEFEEEP